MESISEKVSLTVLSEPAFQKIEQDLTQIKSLLIELGEERLSSKWLTKKEAGAQLKVCSKTLNKYLNNGTLPYSKIRGKIYLKSGDIDDHFMNHYINKSREKRTSSQV